MNVLQIHIFKHICMETRYFKIFQLAWKKLNLPLLIAKVKCKNAKGLAKDSEQVLSNLLIVLHSQECSSFATK